MWPRIQKEITVNISLSSQGSWTWWNRSCTVLSGAGKSNCASRWFFNSLYLDLLKGNLGALTKFFHMPFGVPTAARPSLRQDGLCPVLEMLNAAASFRLPFCFFVTCNAVWYFFSYLRAATENEQGDGKRHWAMGPKCITSLRSSTERYHWAATACFTVSLFHKGNGVVLGVCLVDLWGLCCVFGLFYLIFDQMTTRVLPRPSLPRRFPH